MPRRSSPHRPAAPPPGTLNRAAQYLLRRGRQAALPYMFLLVATLSQLAVPHMVRNVIDAVTNGVIAKTLLEALPQIPAAFLSQGLPQVLSFLQLPAGWNLQQLNDHLTAQQANAPGALIRAGVAIVLFAATRALFAFLQTYWAERNSQSVAFDLRNDLYAKIQRLSFSYHDRNQTGQLMIRATDDVEKLRLFLGQGFLQLVGAVVLLSGTLLIMFSVNAQLAVYTLWILPVAMVLFMIFSTISRPLFTKVQQRLSTLNTVLQENLAGIKVVKAFTREPTEQEKFAAAADKLLNVQLTIARLFSFLFPLIFLIANLGQATTLYLGGKQIV